MAYRGGDVEGLRALRRELRLASASMAVSRAAVERTMNEVCMATTVPMELRRIEASLDEMTARVDRAASALEEDSPPRPIPTTITGFPNDVVGDCGRMEHVIGATLDVLIGRIHDLRADVNNLRVLRPTGTDSFKGHIKQAEGRRRQLVKQLKTLRDYPDCPGSLMIDVARQYITLDIEAELGWSVAAIEDASAASTSKDDDWWDVDIDVGQVAKVGAAAAVIAAAVAAAARDATTGSLALG